MPQEFQHTHDLLSRKPRRQRDDGVDPSTAVEPQKSESSIATDPPGASDLAQFSLLADPTTISGDQTTSAASDDASRDEVARLRSALHAQSRKMAQLQRGTAASTQRPELPRLEAPTSPQHTDGKLLNSIQARQLAEDARAREKAIRAELSSAQDAMRSETEHPAPDTTPNLSRESRQTWRKHSLVRTRQSEETDPAHGAAQAKIPDPHDGATDVDETEHDLLLAANAEVRELRATLSIARKTTLGQKREIAELREQLLLKIKLLGPSTQGDRTSEAENDAGHVSATPHQGLERQLEETQAEASHLRERLRLREQETTARDAERVLLRSTLDQRENEVLTRRREHDELKDRFDAQDRALENARSQFEQERSRNTESQDLLAQLRRALGLASVPTLSSVPMGITSQTRPVSNRDDANVPASLLFADSRDADGEMHQPPAEQEIKHFDAPLENRAVTAFTRPPIFDAWQDDQIHRQFGPMGIDTIIDLLRAPLARRNQSNLQPEQSILLIGRGAWRWAPTLAEGLIQNGTHSFTIHVSDPSPVGIIAVGELAEDHSIQRYLQALPFPSSPESLRDSLAEIRPTALVSRDFLSNEGAVEPWLDVLSTAASTGTCLLFSERTGITQPSPPPEIAAIGDRIWGLMPERYKDCEGVGVAVTRTTTWRRAFLDSDAQSTHDAPPNHLLARLRERFQLEMLAKFGFLAEPFVATPIGENFDKDATRDRKFLHQVSELDDQKIEAGIVPGLHLVAVVDQQSQF